LIVNTFEHRIRAKYRFESLSFQKFWALIERFPAKMLPVYPSNHPIHLVSRAVVCALVWNVLGVSGTHVSAGDGPVVSIVDKEIARRNARIREAQTLITEGAILEAKGEYEQAAGVYRQAWDLLPDSPMTAAVRIEARDGYSRAAVAHAHKLASTGRYSEARALLTAVLAEDFNPGYKEAVVLQKDLDDPDRYEPALTPAHVENVAAVERNLRLGSGFITLGDYQSALARYVEVLRIDPYNQAARRGMERAEQLKSEYYDAARDHTRAKMLSEVDRQWEDSIPVLDVAALFGAQTGDMGALGGTRESMLTKLRTWIIPVVDLQGASLEEVVEFLRIRSRDIDPLKRGVSIVLKVAPETASKPVSMSMVAVPMEEVLRYATEMTGTVYRADEFAITVTSRTERTTALITRSYRVPPGFLENAPAGPAAGAAPADPFAAPAGAAGAGGFTGLQIRRLGAREFLEGRGVPFPEGASASYVSAANLLVVTNTAENLLSVDELVESAISSSPRQVKIEVKMIEVNQTHLIELGFDWLMGQFNVPGSDRVFGSGGTGGNQQATSPSSTDFPFAYPGTGGIPVGINPVTAGLRSTGAILGRPSIDGLIGNVVTPAIDSKSPGAFAISGVFTDPQFQVVLRALNQSKGIDLMAAPSVVTKSGQRATIAIIREFIYPTEFDPPQIPQQIGGTVAGIQNTTAPEVVPITPSTPTAFEKRDIGISLEVEPVISEDGKIVDLNLVPSSVEFEGFIDYGEPIRFSGANAGPGIATENHIFQPIFRTNKVTTSVSVWDGNTIVIGGLMSESRQDLNDKVPILGDIPIIGRAFSSKVSNTQLKNIIFFVSAYVVDPSGNRVNPPVATPAAAVR
jgi:general secretion pathway protein D